MIRGASVGVTYGCRVSRAMRCASASGLLQRGDRLIDDVWMSRSAIPDRFKAATTRSIWRLLEPSASAAVTPLVTTPAENTARSGTRLLRPSAERLKSALVGPSGDTWTEGDV